ncbi:MAG: YcaO-like family protein [Spirochaetaceae bacterium]|nr:YcaO-like family protein [Spirochaetaceae bacterium]
MYNFFSQDTTSFKTDLKNATCIKSTQNFDAIGSAIRNEKRSASLCAIGEAYERYGLMQYNCVPSKKVMAVSLLDMSVREFDINFLREQGILFDSCGCAAHVNSTDCIEKAFLEFIERQSFILWYLSKGKSYSLPTDFLDLHAELTSVFSDARAYELSLLDSRYVVFLIGKIKDIISVSLATANDLMSACEGTVNEIYQMHESIITNSFTKQNSTTSGKASDYGDAYFMVAPEKIANAYRSIEQKALSISLRPSSQCVNLTDEVKELNKKYGMNPYVMFLPTQETNDNNIKVCKVFDLNWFPNLLPKTYHTRIYDYIESATGLKLDRACTYIPFP